MKRWTQAPITSGRRAGEVFGGFGKVSRIRIKRPQIVVSLDVRRVRFEHSFEFGNGLSRLAAFGQHPPQIVSRTDKVRIELDGGIELGKCFFAAASAVKHDPEHVVSNCRAQGCGYGSARRALGCGKVV